MDDVQRKGFVTGIAVQSDKNAVTLVADVADTRTAKPVRVPVVRLTTGQAINQLVYELYGLTEDEIRLVENRN